MTTLARDIAASADDGRWLNTNFLYNNQHYIPFGDISNYSICGSYLRFTNITIPNTATISDASIRLYGNNDAGAGGGQSKVKVRICAADEDNAANPTNATNAKTRTRTTEYVDINGISVVNDDVEYNTPNIANVIQEVISRAGWSSGNAILIFVDNNGGLYGDWEAFTSYDDEQGNTQKARLNIIYSVPTTAPPTTLAPTPGPTTVSPTTSPYSHYVDSISMVIGAIISNSGQQALLSSISFPVSSSILHTDIGDFASSIILNTGSVISLSSIFNMSSELNLNVISEMAEAGIDLYSNIGLTSRALALFRSVLGMNSTLSLSAIAKFGIVDKVWNRKHFSSSPAIDWLTLIGNDVWPFIPQGVKPHYNEGNEISNAGVDPWNTLISGIPITPQHRPWCGYWWRRDVGGGLGPPRPGGPGPTPQPTPIPIPPPDPDWCVGCWGPQQQLHFCPNGKDVFLTPAIVCGLDPIVEVTMFSGSGSVSLSGSIGVYHPGNGGPAIVAFSTQSGLECYAFISDLPDHSCCGGASIGYTSLQMDIDETQEINLIGSNELAEYTLELISGPGSIGGLSPSWAYTAPSENPGCPPAVIGLYCDGDLIASINVSINAINDYAGYYTYCITQRLYQQCSAQVAERHLFCDGSIQQSIYSGCSGPADAGCPDGSDLQTILEGLCNDAVNSCWPWPAYCWTDGCDYGYHDTRSQAYKDQGCCPAQLQ